jgi:hypothetical protein
LNQPRYKGFTHLGGLELDELQTTAVHLNDLLAGLLLLELVGIGTRDDGSRMGFLRIAMSALCSLSPPRVE